MIQAATTIGCQMSTNGLKLFSDGEFVGQYIDSWRW